MNLEEYSPVKFRNRSLRRSSSVLTSISSAILPTSPTAPSSLTTSSPSSQSQRNHQRPSSGRQRPPPGSPRSLKSRTRGCPQCFFILQPKPVGLASGRLHQSGNLFQVIMATFLATCILNPRHVTIWTRAFTARARVSLVIRLRERKGVGQGNMLPRYLCPLSTCS